MAGSSQSPPADIGTSGWQSAYLLTVVTAPTFTPASNKVVVVSLDTQAISSMIQANGIDIRFGGDPLNDPSSFFDHEILDPVPSANTGILVRIPSVLANSQTTFYVFFNNPSVGARPPMTPFNKQIVTSPLTLTGPITGLDLFALAPGVTLTLGGPTVTNSVEATLVVIAGTINGNFLGFSGVGTGGGGPSADSGTGGGGYGGIGGLGGFDSGDTVSWLDTSLGSIC